LKNGPKKRRGWLRSEATCRFYIKAIETYRWFPYMSLSARFLEAINPKPKKA
jgi:hypothetical protein